MKPQGFRDLETHSLTVDNRAQSACERAKELEYKGEYERARQALKAYWPRIGVRPRIAELGASSAAEVLMRSGVLTGIIGSQQQIADAQETAKNLISESLTIFESSGDGKKIAEAQTELALSYWRTGEFNEARDLLEDALSQPALDTDVKAKAVLRLAIVEHQARESHKALHILTSNAELFQSIDNQTLKGSYYSSLANVLRGLWEKEGGTTYLDRALVEYAAASYHFEQAQHRPYQAVIENNLGLLYFKVNAYEEAHEHLDRSRHIQVSLKDISSAAEVDETRACVFLKQGRVTEAERAARLAVNNQEKSGRHALLGEALVTHGRALARLKKYDSSLGAFRRAIDLFEQNGNANRAGEAALALFQELAEHLTVVEPLEAERRLMEEARRRFASGRGLIEEIRSFEHDTIKKALERCQGSVTNAARSLGMSYQALSYMLKTRHKDLLKQRTPARHRPRKDRRSDS